MSSSSWEEIKRLAADFQRVQLVESSSKLSERNCIEIINKLIDLGMLNVYHSIDGKEFITHKQVEREIYDELYVHDGRINIVKLQTLLNIDISYIESKANEIVKRDPNLVIILGQIISRDYMNKISEEINEMLHEKGNISISELTNYYELPADFIHQIVKPRVGTIIKGNYDGNMLYTHDYVNTQKAKLAGVLEASIKPLRFSQIIKEYNLDAAIIFEIYDDLANSGQIKGTLFGGRQALSAVYVPDFFTRAQKQYVEAFIKQNGYIDYSSLKRIGITEPDSYVRSLFESSTLDIEYMSASCFARYFLDNIEQELEENLNRTGLCDLSQILPSTLNSKDTQTLTTSYEKRLKSNHNMETLIMAETYLVSKNFLRGIHQKFESEMEEKSNEDLRKPNFVLSIKSGNAVVGGSQSQPQQQQTTSSGKSKGKGKAAAKVVVEEDSGALAPLEVVFIDKPALLKHVKTILADDANDDLVEAFVEHLLRPLNVQYFELLKTKIEKGLISTAKSNSDGNNSSSGHKEHVSSKPPSIKDVQEKVRVFLLNAKVFDRALKLFSDAKVQEAISKHLIKTVCSEVTNDMVRFIAFEQLQQLQSESLSNEARTKLVQKFKDPFKQKFVELNQSLTNKPYSDVVDLIEKVAVDTIELSLKKADQKREKEVIAQMRENTKLSLESESDPATILHLTLTLLFCQATGLILNSPGRCVPNILEHLKPSISSETFSKLIHFQNVIIAATTGTNRKQQHKQNESTAAEESGEEKRNEEAAQGGVESSSSIESEEINEIRSIGLNAKAHILNTTTTNK